MSSETYFTNRLFAALMASCLLHAAVIVMPYFGASVTVSRPALLHPGPARVLRAKVVIESASAKAAEHTSGGASAAAGAPGRRPAEEAPRPAVGPALGAGLLPIPAPTYYTTDQLSRRPQPTSEPRLLTPDMGPQTPSGKVVLKVWITELGNVAAVEIEDSDLPETVSATAAAAFEKLRFVPGQLNGRAVRSMMRIEVFYYDGAGPPS
jgi:hypothetical protein